MLPVPVTLAPDTSGNEMTRPDNLQASLGLLLSLSGSLLFLALYTKILFPFVHLFLKENIEPVV